MYIIKYNKSNVKAKIKKDRDVGFPVGFLFLVSEESVLKDTKQNKHRSK